MALKTDKAWCRKLCPESAVVVLERLNFSQINKDNNDSNQPSTSSKKSKLDCGFNKSFKDIRNGDWHKASVGSVESGEFPIDDDVVETDDVNCTARENYIDLLKIPAGLTLEEPVFEWSGSIPFSCFGSSKPAGPSSLSNSNVQTKKTSKLIPAVVSKKPELELSSVVKNIQKKFNENKQTKFVPFRHDLPSTSRSLKRKSSEPISNEEFAKRKKAADLINLKAATKLKAATVENKVFFKRKSPQHDQRTVQNQKQTAPNQSQTVTNRKRTVQSQKQHAQNETKSVATGHQKENESAMTVSQPETATGGLAAVTVAIPLKSILRSINQTTSSKKRVTVNLEKNTILELVNDSQPKHYVKNTGQGQMSIDEKHARLEVSKMPLADQLIYAVLQWNSAWLNEYTGDSATDGLPPIIDKQLFKKVNVPSFFVGFNMYVEINKPLYLCEIFEQAYQNFGNHQEKTNGIVNSPRDFKSFLFHDFSVRAIVAKTCDDFQAETLVEFSLPDADLEQSNNFLGFITAFGFSSQPITRFNDIVSDLRDCVPSDKVTDYKVVSFILRMKAKQSVHRNYHGRISFRKILHISSFIRQTETMSLLQSIPFSSCVFNPPAENFFDSKVQYSLMKDKMCLFAKSVFNEDGPKLYSFSFDSVEKRVNGVFDLVESVQNEKFCALDQTKARSAILVIASNQTTLNMISRRIVNKNKQKKTSGNGDRNFANFIRVGDKEEIDDDIWPYSLETLVNINLRQPTREDESATGSDLNISDIQNQIGYTKGLLASLECLDFPDLEEKNRLESSIRELEKRAKSCNVDRVSKTIRLKQKCTIIVHAEVIVVSFQQCLSLPLYSILLDAERRPLRLSCAIVDDADHVLELETLLPLRFGVDKIALFGGCKDEKSYLIKSAVAKQCGFGSFFERIRKRRHT